MSGLLTTLLDPQLELLRQGTWLHLELQADLKAGPGSELQRRLSKYSGLGPGQMSSMPPLDGVPRLSPPSHRESSPSWSWSLSANLAQVPACSPMSRGHCSASSWCPGRASSPRAVTSVLPSTLVVQVFFIFGQWTFLFARIPIKD